MNGMDILEAALDKLQTDMLLEEMYRRYNAAMKHRAMRYVSSHADAEDVVGICWVKLVRHGDKLTAMSDQVRTAYLMKCVRNTSLDYLKHRSWEESHLILENLADTANVETAVEQREAIDELLSHLTTRQRQVVRMQLEGRPVREIAQALQVSESCVRVHWHRSLDRMRSSLIRWKHSPRSVKWTCAISLKS